MKDAASVCERGVVLKSSPRLFPDLDLPEEPLGDEEPEEDSWEEGSFPLNLLGLSGRISSSRRGLSPARASKKARPKNVNNNGLITLGKERILILTILNYSTAQVNSYFGPVN
jgi:hypothetical protein